MGSRALQSFLPLFPLGWAPPQGPRSGQRASLSGVLTPFPSAVSLRARFLPVTLPSHRSGQGVPAPPPHPLAETLLLRPNSRQSPAQVAGPHAARSGHSLRPSGTLTGFLTRGRTHACGPATRTSKHRTCRWNPEQCDQPRVCRQSHGPGPARGCLPPATWLHRAVTPPGTHLACRCLLPGPLRVLSLPLPKDAVP